MQENIKTYIINLEKRTSRRVHSINQFSKKNQFKINFIKAIENKNGALGLWQTIVQIIENVSIKEDDYILICEDDHRFTKNYNPQKLSNLIKEAQEKQADILLGGISWFKDALQVSENLFWIDSFTGLQFTIIFKQFFKKILESSFTANDVADLKISSLTENKFVIAPFVSVQKEFGYSDVTLKNNGTARVERLFKGVNSKLEELVKVANFYNVAK